jgi:hypothetical protein
MKTDPERRAHRIRHPLRQKKLSAEYFGQGHPEHFRAIGRDYDRFDGLYPQQPTGNVPTML